MAVYKNKAGQKIAIYATDAGAAKTGDAANISAQISLDGGTSAATSDAHPTELDATNHPGVYLFDLSQAETDANLIVLSASSTTSGVAIEPLVIDTEPEVRAADVETISTSNPQDWLNIVLSQFLKTDSMQVHLDGEGSFSLVPYEGAAEVTPVAGDMIMWHSGLMSYLDRIESIDEAGVITRRQYPAGTLLPDEADVAYLIRFPFINTMAAAIAARLDVAISTRAAAGTTTVSVLSPVADDASIELVQGDDYPGSGAVVLERSWTGISLTGFLAELWVQPRADYVAGLTTNRTKIGTATQVVSSGTLTVTITITDAETAALESYPPATGPYHYQYQVRLTSADLATVVTPFLGTMTVRRKVGT